MWTWKWYNSPSLEGCVQSFEKNNLDHKVIRDFSKKITFLWFPLGGWRMILMTLGPLEIKFQKTSGHCFALKMEVTFQDMNVGQKVRQFEI